MEVFMKRLVALPLIAFLAIPAFATTTTTTTRSYEATTTAPVMGTDSKAEMMEAEEESFSSKELEQESMEQQRMEESWEDDSWEEQRMEDTSGDMESEGSVDYNDRTRTDRARKALNTGSNASDDQ
jgi:hypothetical protein